MADEDLIHAPAEPDLSHSGQQSSVPTRKTMERIAYDAYRSKVPGAVQWSDILSRDGWQAAADAVIEECLKTTALYHAQVKIDRQDYPRGRSPEFERGWSSAMNAAEEILRSLKYSSSQSQGDRSALPHDQSQRETKEQGA